MTPTQRCRMYRKRILDISQQVSALHIAPAFSCMEIVDCIYNYAMRPNDIFIMSKGHGCMAQYVVLEDRGVLRPIDMERYCKPDGILGAHPDVDIPGVKASTGSLGHGLGIAVGQAHAERVKKTGVRVFCLLSDGEFQEGSTWEAMMVAADLGLGNLIAFVDNNDFGGLDRISERHPTFDPLAQKTSAFGWFTTVVRKGHDHTELQRQTNHALERSGRPIPSMLICKTVKGKGISFMENEPIWHYRSPNPDEYKVALEELG